MRHFFNLLFASTFFIAFNANALLITDTYEVNKKISNGEGHVFDLTQAGYSPSTDSITNIKLIYDFIEIDPDDDTAEDDSREFVIFSSWIFGWRDVHPDIDTGLTIFEMSWERNDMCQFSTTDDELVEYCVYNIDLLGNMNAYVTAYTDNLWLNSIKVEIEVDRVVALPESGAGSLFITGLVILGWLRRFRLKNNFAE